MSIHAYGDPAGVVTIRQTVGATVKELVMSLDDALTVQRQIGCAIGEAAGQQSLDGLDQKYVPRAELHSHAERGR